MIKYDFDKLNKAEELLENLEINLSKSGNKANNLATYKKLGQFGGLYDIGYELQSLKNKTKIFRDTLTNYVNGINKKISQFDEIEPSTTSDEIGKSFFETVALMPPITGFSTIGYNGSKLQYNWNHSKYNSLSDLLNAIGDKNIIDFYNTIDNKYSQLQSANMGDTYDGNTCVTASELQTYLQKYLIVLEENFTAAEIYYISQHIFTQRTGEVATKFDSIVGKNGLNASTVEFIIVACLQEKNAGYKEWFKNLSVGLPTSPNSSYALSLSNTSAVSNYQNEELLGEGTGNLALGLESSDVMTIKKLNIDAPILAKLKATFDVASIGVAEGFIKFFENFGDGVAFIALNNNVSYYKDQENIFYYLSVLNTSIKQTEYTPGIYALTGFYNECGKNGITVDFILNKAMYSYFSEIFMFNDDQINEAILIITELEKNKTLLEKDPENQEVSQKISELESQLVNITNNKSGDSSLNMAEAWDIAMYITNQYVPNATTKFQEGISKNLPKTLRNSENQAAYEKELYKIAINETRKWFDENYFNVEVKPGVTRREVLNGMSYMAIDGFMYSVMNSIGNMIPIIAASFVTGGAGIGSLSLTSDVMMFSSAFGGAVESGLNRFSTTEEMAANYDTILANSFLTASVEVLSEHLSGGLLGMGANTKLDDIIENAMLKLVNGRGGAITRTLIKTFVKANGEGLEELFSMVCEPFILSATYCEDSGFIASLKESGWVTDSGNLDLASVLETYAGGFIAAFIMSGCGISNYRDANMDMATENLALRMDIPVEEARQIVETANALPEGMSEVVDNNYRETQTKLATVKEGLNEIELNEVLSSMSNSSVTSEEQYNGLSDNVKSKVDYQTFLQLKFSETNKNMFETGSSVIEEIDEEAATETETTTTSEKFATVEKMLNESAAKVDSYAADINKSVSSLTNEDVILLNETFNKSISQEKLGKIIGILNEQLGKNITKINIQNNYVEISFEDETSTFIKGKNITGKDFIEKINGPLINNINTTVNLDFNDKAFNTLTLDTTTKQNILNIIKTKTDLNPLDITINKKYVILHFNDIQYFYETSETINGIVADLNDMKQNALTKPLDSLTMDTNIKQLILDTIKNKTKLNIKDIKISGKNFILESENDEYIYSINDSVNDIIGDINNDHKLGNDYEKGVFNVEQEEVEELNNDSEIKPLTDIDLKLLSEVFDKNITQTDLNKIIGILNEQLGKNITEINIRHNDVEISFEDGTSTSLKGKNITGKDFIEKINGPLINNINTTVNLDFSDKAFNTLTLDTTTKQNILNIIKTKTDLNPLDITINKKYVILHFNDIQYFYETSETINGIVADLNDMKQNALTKPLDSLTMDTNIKQLILDTIKNKAKINIKDIEISGKNFILHLESDEYTYSINDSVNDIIDDINNDYKLGNDYKKGVFNVEQEEVEELNNNNEIRPLTDIDLKLLSEVFDKNITQTDLNKIIGILNEQLGKNITKINIQNNYVEISFEDGSFKIIDGNDITGLKVINIINTDITDLSNSIDTISIDDSVADIVPIRKIQPSNADIISNDTGLDVKMDGYNDMPIIEEYNVNKKNKLNINFKYLFALLAIGAIIAVINFTLPDNEKTNTLRITLNGDELISLYKNNEYLEPGYTAYDDTDGDITEKVIVNGLVDVSTLGTYVLNYSVTNSLGQNATASRTINIVNLINEVQSDYDLITVKLSDFNKQIYKGKDINQLGYLNMTNNIISKYGLGGKTVYGINLVSVINEHNRYSDIYRCNSKLNLLEASRLVITNGLRETISYDNTSCLNNNGIFYFTNNKLNTSTISNKEEYNKIIDSQTYNTFVYQDAIIENGLPSISNNNTSKMALCQSKTNELNIFIFKDKTDYNGILKAMQSNQCSVGVTLPDSDSMMYKSKYSTSINFKYGINHSVDSAIYFVED